ncbi:HugZ family protein [Paracoccus limosus]|nr:pyridoxamine 5'-phosphate oxidase family protein [Paracoccus limosus]
MDPIRPTDDEARALARRLIHAARHATLGSLDPASGAPLVTRIALQVDRDGVPLALLSGLAAHTRALMADPRAGLMITDAEAAKGDPMTHARLSIIARAEPAPADAARRDLWLARDPKARVYVDLPDFRFWRLVPQSALLNGGFGRAFHLDAQDLLTPGL